MLHISKHKEERRFTYRDISEYSSKAANYFKSLGIRKGDKVMLVLKRHYQFWFSLLALHKIGAVAIPASFLLVEQDYEYRFEAGDIHYIVATEENEVADKIDLADSHVHRLKEKIIVGESRLGWHNFDKEFEAFSPVFERPVAEEERTSGEDISIMIFTSGTTKHAKLTVHNFRYPLGHFVTARYWHQVDPDGALCQVGEPGELVICTEEGEPDGLFLGYYQDEKKTKQQWHDGYYHTGDQVRVDEEGYFWYEGRIDDLIKASGYRIGPFEIESELMKLPFILECAVTSVPDNTRGQAIKASIVLTKGATVTEKLRKDIFSYINENIASYKRPRLIEFVKSLPKTSSGKIKRGAIHKMAE